MNESEINECEVSSYVTVRGKVSLTYLKWFNAKNGSQNVERIRS